MKKALLLASACALFIICQSDAANAQVTYTAAGVNMSGNEGGSAAPTATVTTTIAPILDLAVNQGSSVDFDFSDIAKLDEGITKEKAVKLSFRSNKDWVVNVNANAANFTGTGADVSTMPASVLQYRLGGTTTFKPLTETAAAVTNASNEKGSGIIEVDYKMNPQYKYGPGDYTIELTYTISNL